MRDERGMGLVLALFVAMIASIMVVSTLEAMMVGLKIGENFHNELKAYYIAEAGVETAIRMLKEDVNWDEGFDGVEFPPGSGGRFTVVLSRPDPDTVRIESTGEIGGASKRVSVTIRIK